MKIAPVKVVCVFCYIVTSWGIKIIKLLIAICEKNTAGFFNLSFLLYWICYKYTNQALLDFLKVFLNICVYIVTNDKRIHLEGQCVLFSEKSWVALWEFKEILKW